MTRLSSKKLFAYCGVYILLQRYLDAMRSIGLSENTINTRRRALTTFLAWMKGHVGEDDPKTITPTDAVRYRRYLQDAGRKPNTVNTHLSAIHAFCAWMVEEGYIQENPVKKVEFVKIVKSGPKGLDRNERHRFERTAFNSKNCRDWAIVMTFLYAGLRVGELVELKPEDVIIQERKGTIVVREGKGNKYREVPIPKELRECLSEYIVKNCTSGEYLFEGQRAPKLTERAVQLIIDKIAYAAKVPDVTPHMLRHTYAYALVDNNVPIDRVAQLLGHENVNTTAIYTRPRPAQLQADVEKLNNH